MRHAKPETVAPPEPSVDWPLVIFSFLAGLFFLVLARLVIARHNNFYTFDYDLGIFDQAIWLLSRGSSFITIRGLEVFGHHANLGFVLLVPFYWLGAGANFLNVLMVAGVTAGAIPIHHYSRQLLNNAWQALVLPLAYLAHFATSWIVNETFHPEVLAIAPLFAAFVDSTREQWKPYVIWLIAAGIWKEDVSLAILMIGVIVAIRGHRRIGLITAGAGLAYFLLATRVMIPAFSNGGAFYDGFFGEIGSGVFEVIFNAIRRPSLVINAFTSHDALGYVRDLLFPYSFVPLIAPTALLIGLPQFAINMLSVHGLSANVQVHYVAMPLVAATLALVEGIARIKRPGWRRFALGAIAATALTTSAQWGLLPYSQPYDQGNWPTRPNTRAPAMEIAVSYPQPDDGVAATWNLVPHLSHRHHIYTFPNPWTVVNWGTGVETPPDPAVIDWLVVDRQILGESTDDFEMVLAEETWEIVFERDGIVVAKRAT
jgi:uncharacterized membrane protein